MSLYATLGVAADADTDTIKRAYRKEAMAHHPDRGGEHAKMQAVQAAYDVLGDPVRRQLYDETGETSAAPPREDKARSTLAQLINEVLDLLDKGSADDLAYVNPLQATREQLTANQKQNEAVLEKLQRRTKQREEALRRLTRKGGEGSDVLADALQGAIAHLHREVAKVGELQTLISDILGLLDGYTYEVAERPQRTVETQDFYGSLERAFDARFGAWPGAAGA